jgi:hypothetical protein
MILDGPTPGSWSPKVPKAEPALRFLEILGPVAIELLPSSLRVSGLGDRGLRDGARSSKLFPEVVPFDGESFGTVATSPLFSRLRAWESAKENGEGKVTPVELFSAGVMDLEADVRELIHAA